MFRLKFVIAAEQIIFLTANAREFQATRVIFMAAIRHIFNYFVALFYISHIFIYSIVFLAQFVKGVSQD